MIADLGNAVAAAASRKLGELAGELSSSFTFVAPPGREGALRVVCFTGREAISELYELDVLLGMPTPHELLPARLQEALLGQPGRLTLRGARGERSLSGVVASIALEGKAVETGQPGVRLKLVPRLWLLTQRRTSRIFQELSVPEIIDRVLDEWAIPRDWRLAEVRTPRAYCTQYQETDYEFVTRLLAEEGIFFTFAPAEAEGPADRAAAAPDVLVLSDHEQSYAPVPAGVGAMALPSLSPPGAGRATGLAAGMAAQAAQGLAGQVAAGLAPGALGAAATFAVEHGHRAVDPDALLDFTLRGAVRPNAVLHSSYDPARPLYRPLDSAQLGGPAGRGPAAGPHLAATMDPGFLSVHDHHPRGAPAEGDGAGTAARARRTLAQLRRDALVGEARSGNCRLAPGLTFPLRGHPLAEADGEYVVVALEHRGIVQHMCRIEADEAYRNVLRCAPAGAPFRPPVPPRRMAQVAETATVVGPPGEEIHTDAAGRIRVHFHWDQEQRPEEGTSSCWIRVVQPWAGTGYGSQFIPRVGSEVLVTFVRGDPDDPVAVGGLFNGGAPAPFDLPHSRTRSGFRTASTSGTGGYNELAFEDSAGAEAIQLHAQRDFAEEVGRAHVQHVHGAQSVLVEGGRTKLVHAADVELVLGTKRSEVALDRVDEVRGDHRARVLGARSDAVEGADTREIGLDQTVTVRGARSVIVNGHLSTRVGTKKQPAELLATVEGVHTTRATRRILLASDEEIVLQCGKSKVVVGPDEVRITSPRFAVEATDAATLRAAGAALSLTETAELTGQAVRQYSQGASVELTATADINGAMVNLNCGAGSPKGVAGKSDGPKTRPVKTKLHDDEMNPFAGKRYRLVAGDFLREGTTGSGGEVDEQVPAESKVAQLTLWIEGYPAGPTMEWDIELTDEPLDPARGVRGALQRLLHLGYYAGEVGSELTVEGQAALRWFQSDSGLEQSGELDGPTAKKLEEVHGA